MHTVSTRAPARVTPHDVVVAVLAGAFSVGASIAFAGVGSGGGPVARPAIALLVATAATLVVRRRYPVAVLLITAVSAVVYPHVAGSVGGPFMLPMMVAVFTAAAMGLRVWAVGVAGAFLVVFVMFGVLSGAAPREALPIVPGWLVAVLVAGEVARSRREYRAEAERRAAEAERTREEEALRRATEERLRIAREVHDVLSHSISMINFQAGVAVHLLDTRPEQARIALVAIKQASKNALRDLRATLGVLREADAQDGARVPAGGLHRLDELVAGAEAAGLRLEVHTSGEPRELPAGVDLAAYRIVQESVSNIVRHAGTSTGTVTLRFGRDDLTVTIDNAAGARNGTASPGAGDGIRGMRERAEALGGELAAGPRPDGGFRVRAQLPLDAAP
ncbi:MAG TPA: sensor histidine kinase [Euzebyales bacterium]|nr:sensor histidine kinase [Euzebyales bacterium]